jgi:hypothetical protein
MAASNQTKGACCRRFSLSNAGDYVTSGNKISLPNRIAVGNGCECGIIEFAPQPTWHLTRCLPAIQALAFHHGALSIDRILRWFSTDCHAGRPRWRWLVLRKRLHQLSLDLRHTPDRIVNSSTLESRAHLHLTPYWLRPPPRATSCPPRIPATLLPRLRCA